MATTLEDTANVKMLSSYFEDIDAIPKSYILIHNKLLYLLAMYGESYLNKDACGDTCQCKNKDDIVQAYNLFLSACAAYKLGDETVASGLLESISSILEGYNYEFPDTVKSIYNYKEKDYFDTIPTAALTVSKLKIKSVTGSLYKIILTIKPYQKPSTSSPIPVEYDVDKVRFVLTNYLDEYIVIVPELVEENIYKLLLDEDHYLLGSVTLKDFNTFSGSPLTLTPCLVDDYNNIKDIPYLQIIADNAATNHNYGTSVYLPTGSAFIDTYTPYLKTIIESQVELSEYETE